MSDPVIIIGIDNLHKSETWPPKGRGWQPIKNPRGGGPGMRRLKPSGKGFEYVYQADVQTAKPKPRKQANVSAGQMSLFGAAPDPPKVAKVRKQQGERAAKVERIKQGGKLQRGATLNPNKQQKLTTLVEKIKKNPLGKPGKTPPDPVKQEKVDRVTADASRSRKPRIGWGLFDARSLEDAAAETRERAVAKVRAERKPRAKTSTGTKTPPKAKTDTATKTSSKVREPRKQVVKAPTAGIDLDTLTAELAPLMGKDGSTYGFKRTMQAMQAPRATTWALKFVEAYVDKYGASVDLRGLHKVIKACESRSTVLSAISARIYSTTERLRKEAKEGKLGKRTQVRITEGDTENTKVDEATKTDAANNAKRNRKPKNEPKFRNQINDPDLDIALEGYPYGVQRVLFGLQSAKAAKWIRKVAAQHFERFNDIPKLVDFLQNAADVERFYQNPRSRDLDELVHIEGRPFVRENVGETGEEIQAPPVWVAERRQPVLDAIDELLNDFTKGKERIARIGDGIELPDGRTGQLIGWTVDDEHKLYKQEGDTFVGRVLTHAVVKVPGDTVALALPRTEIKNAAEAVPEQTPILMGDLGRLAQTAAPVVEARIAEDKDGDAFLTKAFNNGMGWALKTVAEMEQKAKKAAPDVKLGYAISEAEARLYFLRELAQMKVGGEDNSEGKDAFWGGVAEAMGIIWKTADAVRAGKRAMADVAYTAEEFPDLGSRHPADAAIAALPLARQLEQTLATIGLYGGRPGWGPAKRKEANLSALDVLASGAVESDQDRETLKGYSGRGGIAKDCMGALNEYYTPPALAATCWAMLRKAGFTGGDVLEPSCGTGVFLEHKPQDVDCKVVGVELDRTAGAVARALHVTDNNEVVVGKSMEQFAIADMRQYSAAIGNPPYGARGGTGAADPEKTGLTAEQYGLDVAIDKLDDFGLCAMVVPCSVMSGSSTDKVEFRERLARKAEFLGAYRMPSGSFGNAGTGIPTDLVVFRRKPHAIAAAGRLATPEELTALSKRFEDGEAGAWPTSFVNGTYFKDNPAHVIGKQVDGHGGRIEVEGDLTHEALVSIVDGFTPPRRGEYTLDVLTSIVRETDPKRADRMKGMADSQRPYQAPIGQTRAVDGVTRVLRETGPGVLEWIRVDDVSELHGLGDKQRQAHKEAEEIGKGIMELQKLIRTEPNLRSVDLYRTQVREKAIKWREAYGIPKANGKVIEKLADLRVACAFSAMVREDGEICDLLRYQIAAPKEEAPDPTEFPTVALAADYLARKHNGVIVPMDVARLMGTNDDSAVQRALLTSEDYYLDDDGQFVDRPRFLSGYLYEKLDTIMLGATLARAAAKDAAHGGVRKLFDKAARKLSVEAGPVDETRAAMARRLSFYGKQGLLDDAKLLARKLTLQAALLQDKLAPTTTTFEEIDVGPGDGWVPHDLLQAFWATMGEGKAKIGSLRYTGARYVVDDGNGVRVDLEASWPPKGGSTAKAFLNVLNREPLGKAQKVLMHGIADRFRQWIGEDDERRLAVEDSYNRTFHSHQARTASHDALDLKGWDHGQWAIDEETGKRKHVSGGWSPHGYQYQVARWALETGRGILGDDVGLGKTTEIIAMISALQAAGGARKPVIVVPKALLRNWEKEIKDLRPGAKIKIIGEKVSKAGVASAQTGKEKAAAWQEVAVNQYDFVLASRQSFGMLRLGEDRAERYYDGEFENRNHADKDAESYAKKRTKYLANMKDKEAKKAKDGAPLLEDVGIDALFLDEGHGYKNLYAAKQGRSDRIKYLGGSAVSKQAVDMAWKSKAIRELNGGNGVYIATATPVKNSPLEVYNMMSLVAPEVFEDRGIRNVSEFVQRYCATEERLTFDAKGEPVTVKCVVGFKNLRELRNIIGQFMVIRDAAQVGLAIPDEVTEGHVIDMAPEQQHVYETLRKAMNKMREEGGSKGEITTTEVEEGTDEAIEGEEGTKKKKGKKRAAKTTREIMQAIANGKGVGKDHMFKILHAMQVVSTDPQMAAELMAEEGYRTKEQLRSPKLEAVAKSVVARMAQARAAGRGGGQIIFSDLMNKIHGRIVEHLVAEGIPRDRIGIINRKECPTAADQQAVALAFQEGRLDVVIGNTACMGEGVNLQKRSTDMHHVDVPWDPGSLQQRKGRMRRQGSPEKEVTQHFYGARGTFDFYKQQTMQGKANWIHDLWHGTGDGLRIPPETQGFSEEDMIIFGAADPEKAQQEVADRRRKLELANADGAVKKAMKLYTDLRRAYNEAVRLQTQKAAGKKTNETMLAAKLRFVERARAMLQDDIFFPEKDALSDEMLGKSVVVPATGLPIIPGMTLKWEDDKKVKHYFEVHETEARTSASGVHHVTVTGRELGFTLDTAKTHLSSGSLLDRCVASGFTALDAVPLLLAAVKSHGPKALQSMSQAEVDANEEGLQAAMSEWARGLQSSGAVYGWQTDQHAGKGDEPDLFGFEWAGLHDSASNSKLQELLDEPSRIFIGSTAQLDRLHAFRDKLVDSVRAKDIAGVVPEYGIQARQHESIGRAVAALQAFNGTTQNVDIFELQTADRQTEPTFASWLANTLRVRGAAAGDIHGATVPFLLAKVVGNTVDGDVDIPIAEASIQDRRKIAIMARHYTIGLMRDMRAGKITWAELRKKAPSQGFIPVVGNILFGEQGGKLFPGAGYEQQIRWREPFLSLPGVADDELVAGMLADEREADRVSALVALRDETIAIATSVRGGKLKYGEIPGLRTKLKDRDGNEVEVELRHGLSMEQAHNSFARPKDLKGEVSYDGLGSRDLSVKFPRLSVTSSKITLDPAKVYMSAEDQAKLVSLRRQYEAEVAVEHSKAKKAAKQVKLSAGAFSLLEDLVERGATEEGFWRGALSEQWMEVDRRSGTSKFGKDYDFAQAYWQEQGVMVWDQYKRREVLEHLEAPKAYADRIKAAGGYWNEKFGNYAFPKKAGVDGDQAEAFFRRIDEVYKQDKKTVSKLLEMGVRAEFLTKDDVVKSETGASRLREASGPAIVIGLDRN